VSDQTYDLTTTEGLIRRAVETTERRIPERFRGAETTHLTVARWCRAYGPGCQSLLILGPTGVGKTHAAFAAIRSLAARGQATGWEAVRAPDLYARLRPRDGVDSEAEFRSVAGCELLLLDDLGAAKASEWTEEVNYRLLSHRYDARLPMIITSNLPAAARPGQPSLAVAVGDRVMSRIAGMCEQVALRGPDRRTAAS
jgi:DNA replication protein DnaC